MKRTTLVLEDGCMEGIRALAKQTDRNMSDIVNELLRDGLRMCRDLRVERFKLPAQAMGQPRVNVADRDALESARAEARPPIYV